MRMRRMGLIVLGVTVAMAGCKKAPKSDDNKRAKKGSGQAAAPVKPVMDGPVPADAMGALDKHADKTPTPSSPAVGGAVAAMPGPSDQRAKPTAGAGPVNPNAGAMVGKPDPRIMPLGSGPVNPNDPNAVAVMKPGPGPKAIMTSVTVKGGLKTAIVRRVIRRHLVELKYCYVSLGLQSNSKLKGMIKVSFNITMTGLTKAVKIAASTLNHKQTQGCIRSAFWRWRWPKPEGALPRVTATFSFLIQ